jgi:hypothetical protein
MLNITQPAQPLFEGDMRCPLSCRAYSLSPLDLSAHPQVKRRPSEMKHHATTNRLETSRLICLETPHGAERSMDAYLICISLLVAPLKLYACLLSGITWPSHHHHSFYACKLEMRIASLLAVSIIHTDVIITARYQCHIAPSPSHLATISS